MHYRENKVVEQKGEEGQKNNEKENRFNNTEQRKPEGLHGGEFVIFGKVAITHNGSQQNRQRDTFWYDGNPCITK